MAITEVKGRVPPSAALRAEIAKRRGGAMVAASGLGPVLDILDAYVAVTDSELRELRERVGKLEGR
jgi:hypothetical protein